MTKLIPQHIVSYFFGHLPPLHWGSIVCMTYCRHRYCIPSSQILPRKLLWVTGGILVIGNKRRISLLIQLFHVCGTSRRPKTSSLDIIIYVIFYRPLYCNYIPKLCCSNIVESIKYIKLPTYLKGFNPP